MLTNRLLAAWITLLSAASPAQADIVFWLSDNPARGGGPGMLVKHVNQFTGVTAPQRLYLWAELPALPGTDGSFLPPAFDLKVIGLNLAINNESAGDVIDLTGVSLDNPVLTPGLRRYETVIDTQPDNPHCFLVSGGCTVRTPDPSGDRIDNVVGVSLGFPDDIGVGVGRRSIALGEAGTYDGRHWRIGVVELTPQAVGVADLHIEIGQTGIRTDLSDNPYLPSGIAVRLGGATDPRFFGEGTPITLGLIDSNPEARLTVRTLPLPDYNGDGMVNSGDYTVWRDTLGSSVDRRADGNLNGLVDIDDYQVWKDAMIAVGASTATIKTPTPEPQTVVLIANGAIGAFARRSVQSVRFDSRCADRH